MHQSQIATPVNKSSTEYAFKKCEAYLGGVGKQYLAKIKNEHALLCNVAEAAESHQNSQPGEELQLWAKLQDALTALQQFRKSGGE